MRRRILIAALLSVVIMLVTVGVISSISVQAEIEHALDRTLDLATVAANYTDHLLGTNLARLYDVSLSGVVDLQDGDWEPERKALERAYQYSIFAGGLFLLDSKANIVLSYPYAQVSARDIQGIADVERAYREARPFYSGVHVLPETGRRAMFAFAPLRDRQGVTVGVIGGEIDPTTHFLSNSVRSIPDATQTVIELVDDQGTVIASSHPRRVFSCSDRDRVLGGLIESGQKAVFQCHRCHTGSEAEQQEPQHTTDVLAFAPLQEAPWGIAVREPESDIYAPSDDLKRRFFMLGLVLIGSALALGIAISRSVVNPIQDLTQAATRIAGGELGQAVQIQSEDEIGALGRSFETMRAKLADTLQTLQSTNLELEQRVEERTAQLRQSRRRLSNLLGKVMSAQEEERKRIARELHDETLQATAALGLSLEVATISLKEGKLRADQLLSLKANVDRLIDGINLMIQDLRPPMLDDLGLESALRWLTGKHLTDRDIHCTLEFSEEFKARIEAYRRASGDNRLELSMFRIIQEALTNIGKHSQASQASVRLSAHGDWIQISVQDNGKGFNVAEALHTAGRRGGFGFGLLGVRERAALLDGDLKIQSKPGKGTKVQVRIPVLEVLDASH